MKLETSTTTTTSISTGTCTDTDGATVTVTTKSTAAVSSSKPHTTIDNANDANDATVGTDCTVDCTVDSNSAISAKSAGSNKSANSASGMLVDTENPVHARTYIDTADDTWNDNPDQVEELLSRELYKLSLEERNKFQDEIHGVSCLAPEETPELLRTSLKRMENELDHVIPLDQKRAYLQTKTQTNLKNSYIHQDDFKLRFLRCELFNVPKAAIRMALFLDLLVDIFGAYALERPIKLSDFNKKELCEFRKGKLQLLLDRDRGGAGTGRRILCIFPDREWEDIPPKVRHKIALYQTWVMGNDVDTQRKGLVFLAWFDSNRENSYKPNFATKISQLPSVRISSLHICTPDTAHYRMRRAMVVMISGKYRSNLRIHIGEPTELRYALQAFGLSCDIIPITHSGTIKTANIKKWMRFRHHVEDADLTTSPNSSVGGVGVVGGEVENIDCPYMSDIIFRKGKNMSSHPGNALMRRVMKQKIESGVFQSNDKYKTRQFINDVIRELKQQGNTRSGGGLGANHNPPVRLLEWDDVSGYFWREFNDEEAIYHKMRHIVKEYQMLVKEEKANKRKTQPMINQRGGTAIFQFQDNKSALPFTCPSSCQITKKQKLTADDDHDDGRLGGEKADSASCFGGKVFWSL